MNGRQQPLTLLTADSRKRITSMRDWTTPVQVNRRVRPRVRGFGHQFAVGPRRGTARLQRDHMANKQTAAGLLVDTLIDWGVEIIFGLPGDGINGIVEALRTRQDRIRFIVARHEEAAAFMACAYAKWTGRIGCCLATTGPGGVHLLTGLYDAKFDRAPVLAITGLPYHDLIQTSTQQDIDHVRLFQDVAEHAAAITGAAQVAQATTLACRTALARKGVAHLAIPVDVQEQEIERDQPSPRNKAGATRVFSDGRVTPRADDIEKAAALLNKGSKIAILAGQGAS